jgi:hypothetical protein
MDAEGDDPALPSRFRGASARIVEMAGLANDVVGSEHQHQRFGIALQCKRRGHRDCWAGKTILAVPSSHDY